MQINSSYVINNINKLYNTYKDRIKSDKHLLLLYWKDVDGVEINKESISTPEFLSKATSPMKILQCKQMYEILKENGEIE